MLSSPATFSIQPAPAAIAGIAEADQLLIKNKFREAEDAYRSLLDSDDSGDAYAGLAVSLAKQGTPKSVNEAEKILKEARDKFPENPNVIAAGGYVSYVHSKGVASPAKRDLYLEAAAALCKRAIKANPDILIAQQTLGLVAIAQDDIDSAVEPLTKAKELAETPANLTLLAQVLLKTSPKEFDTPGDLLKQALSLKPDYAAAHLQKALLLEAQNKQEDAFSELQGVPEPERNAEWYCAEGDIYKTQGDGPAALAAWHESVRRDPHNPDPYRHLSEYYAMRGDGEVAIEQMHNALEILPNDMSLRGQLAELALRQDKLDVADTEYRTILATDPDDAAALLGLSRVGYRKARRDGGVYPEGWSQLMDKLQNVVTEQQVKGVVVKAGTKNLQQNIQLSEAEKFLSQNQFRKAREIFTGVINQNRDDPYQLLTLGEQAMNDGDLKSAEQAFTFAKEIPQVAPRADQDLSKIAQQRGEAARQTKLGDAMWKTPDVALDYYNQALIADPQYPPAYFGRYSLYERTDTDQAIRNAVCFLEAADDSNPDRSEVEANLVRLKKRVGPKAKGK
jgi:tetratricopeptide (TPR) repeat protein